MAFNNLRSPGVQITEKDLSLRANFNPGTNIVVTGFASQGPTSEPIVISTASELESVFGIPYSPAEKYFYYTCREVLNSAGSLISIRLPYGESTGSGFDQYYSGLFYPMARNEANSLEKSQYNTFVGLTASIIDAENEKIQKLNEYNTFASLTAGIVTRSIQRSQYDYYFDELYPEISTNNLIDISLSALSALNQLYTLSGIAGIVAPISSIALSACLDADPEASGAFSIAAIEYSSDLDTAITDTEQTLNELNTLSGIVGITDPISVIALSTVSVSQSATFFTNARAYYNTISSAFNFSQLNALYTLSGVSGVSAPISSVALSTVSVSQSATFFNNLRNYFNNLSDDPLVDDKVTWEIKAPRHVKLTEEQYNSILNGNYVWQTPTGLSDNFSVNADNEVVTDAGFFILNKLQTSVNEIGEGFYVGFADNTALYADSPNFESIKNIRTLNQSVSTTTSYSSINTNKLDFSLSASSAESNRGITSVSETLEKVGFVGFETDEYQDHISLGIFRVRRSVADASILTLGTVEKHLASFDFARKQTNLAGGANPPSAFLEDVINDNSSTALVYVNPAISKAFDWTEGNTLPVNRVSVHESAKALYPFGTYVRTVYNDEINKVIGEVPLKLDKALRFVENPEDTLVDIVVDAGLSNIYATTKYNNVSSFDDEVFVEDTTSLYENWKSVTDIFVNFAEKNRKDCVAIIDMPRSIFIQGKNQKVIDAPGKNFTTDIYNHLRDFAGPYETNYAATYANWVKINDSFTGRKMWMPFSAFAAAIYANSDATAYPWSAPAGLNRGVFNVIDIAFNPNQKQRDRLYEISVNPVVYFSGDGFSVMGQKTLQTKPTAFDRINVRRLFLTLERATQRALKYFVFEPNTEFTRNRLKNTIAPLFEFAKNTEGVYDYLIVCDSRNNLPDTIDNNELIVDIYLKPVRTAEFILVNFIATRTSQNFTELI